MLNIKEQQRIYRHQRIRKGLAGTAQRPRLCLHRSLNNLQAQIVDDSAGKVLIGKSTLAKDVKSKLKSGGNVSAASILGEALAQRPLKKESRKSRLTAADIYTTGVSRRLPKPREKPDWSFNHL